jgi:UDP-4-amino-4,6-dideoxy-N-acetyl-beta-L-altrosamine transaminase
LIKNKKSYNYGKQSISFRDIWEVVKVLRSPWLTQGPKVKEFENEICKYTGAKYAVAVANGTAALHLAALTLNLKSTDYGITSPNTFLASANCMLYAGAKVKFADIEPETGNIDSKEIAKQITHNTKVIIPVHFAGQSCDMEAISDLAKKHNLWVIEDAAQAIGSKYKNTMIGSCAYSNMTIFSFHPVKTIATGEGGAITTNDPKLYEKLCTLRTIGVTKNPEHLTKNDGPWYYETHMLGFNYRMSDIHAALGLSQLKRLDKFVKKRRNLVDLYRKEFSNDKRFSLLEEKPYSKAAFHLCPLLINFDKISLDKKQLFEKLKSSGLHLQVHYIPVHLQPLYKNIGFTKGNYPKSEQYYKKTISLPLYPNLCPQDIMRISNTIKNILSEKNE